MAVGGGDGSGRWSRQWEVVMAVGGGDGSGRW